MQTRYPEQAQRIIAVMNGCDEEELPTAERSRRFVIAYAGTLYLDRDPSNLFRAAARVVSALELAPADFAIELMGAVGSFDGRSIERLAGELGLEGYVRLHPRGTRGAAMEFLARATMLVNLPQDSHLAIPSKVFEYMRYDAWLHALAQRDSATELLLRDTEADVVAPDDVDGLAAVLQRRYREHADGRRARSIAAGDRFSRRTQAERLFSAVEQITGPPRSIPSPSES
jgi:glycosyltransferase involved in cell wall biosynthesis